MKTPADTLDINAFVDGELDLASQLDMEQRLRDDDALRRRVAATRQLRDAVCEGASYHAAPQALRARLAALHAPSLRPASVRRAPMASAVHRWLAWRPLVASLSVAAVLAVAVDVAWLASSQEDRLAEDVLASHVRSTLGEHLLDVASSDHHTVKPFLSAKLDFSPPVDELKLPGSVFLGGRVDYLAGRPVAALVYRQGAHIVNAFVWPETRSPTTPRFSAERGFQIAHWSHDNMTHWVISDVNREEFKAVVQAVQTAGTEH